MEEINISNNQLLHLLTSQKNNLKEVETIVKTGIVLPSYTVESTYGENFHYSLSDTSICESETVRRLESENSDSIHGFLGDCTWTAPRMTKYCAVEARPGYATELAHEYEDEEEVLDAKIDILANLIRLSRACVIYTGAGLSTAAGIGDYATKSDGENTNKGNASKYVLRTPLAAQPTYAHLALRELFHNDLVHYWVQQNHDGLPQKAGVPQHLLNEIHGAWYDPSNPVVQMSGQLRDDLFESLLEWEKKCDLTISMGTSMCGMNSDRVFTTVSKRAKKNFQKNKERSLLGLMKKYLPPSSNNGSTVLGGVIIAIQRTQHDALASLRIYSKIDKVMILLLAKLNIDDSRVTQSYNLLNGISSSDRNKEENESDDYIRLTIPNKYRLDEHVLKVKYDENGHLQDDGDNNSFILDLSPGAKVRIVGGPYDGDLGEVSHINKGGNYAIQFMHAINKTTQVKKPFMRVLGWWWVQAAVEGTVTTLPVVNCL